MKVLLVFPPAEIAPLNIKNITPPLGIAYLGAVLEGAGHTVSLLDCQIEGYDNVTKQGWSQVRFGLSPDEIASRIAKESPGLIGVSCLFSPMAEQAKEVLRICKQAAPQAHTVFGGLHPSLYPEDALSELSADIVFQGQGEDAFPTLVDALSRSEEVASIPGVRLRSRDQVATNSTGSPAPYLNNLDDLPLPAWHLLPMESYFAINFPHGNQVRRERVAPMLTSRGCPFKCGFCAAGLLWNGQIAYRSPENVVSEIEFLINEYGVQEVHFEDDNLTMDRNRALALFRLMAERTPKMKWNAPGGISPTNLDDEVLEAMAQSGCYEVNLAVESGNERVLTKIVGKPNFLGELQRIVTTCKGLGILVHGFFMVGLPDERRHEMRQTLQTPIRLGFTDAYYGRWIPVPGTRLYKEAVSEGIIRPQDVSFSDLHMTGRIRRLKGLRLGVIERAIALANWRMKLRLIVLHPATFYWRYFRILLKNPFTVTLYMLDQMCWALMPGLRRRISKR